MFPPWGRLAMWGRLAVWCIYGCVGLVGRVGPSGRVGPCDCVSTLGPFGRGIVWLCRSVWDCLAV